MSKQEQTKVIFRKWPNGDIIALFPEIPSDNQGYNCLSYEHVGQHGGCDTGIIACTKLATEAESKDLKAELESIGYVLRVVRRMRYSDLQARQRELKEMGQ